jgi:hypothetical protein
MTSMTNNISKLAAAVGLAAMLAGGAATPSLADSNDGGPFFYEPNSNGSVWSYYPGYTDKRTVGRSAYTARAQAREQGRARAPARSGGYFAHGAPDDPPGSAFQSFGNDQDMGKVR